MCNWSSILNEVNASANPALVLQTKRAEFFAKITSITGRNVITYYSGWLKNSEAPKLPLMSKTKMLLWKSYINWIEAKVWI